MNARLRFMPRFVFKQGRFPKSVARRMHAIMPSRLPPLFPTITLLLYAGALAYAGFQPDLERNLKGWLVMASSLLAALLLVLWFLLSRRFRTRIRLLGFLALILLLVASRFCVKVDGVIDGRGLPRLAWRWSIKPAKPAVAQPSQQRSESRGQGLSKAAEVPQFFGPRRDGHAPAVRLDPDWLKHPPRELWRHGIGAGWSAFAVSDGLAYTQEQQGEKELVTCYDLLTGALVWSHSDTARFDQWQSSEGPRATPTLHQGRVYTYGATGILNCLDAATGRPVWQRRVLEENKIANLEWGVCASPLIAGNLVIVTGGRTRGPVLFAHDLANGSPVWKAGDDEAGYASPILTTLAGRQIILSNNARSLTAHDPSTGELLMEHAWGVEKWPKASQPVIAGPNQLFLSAGYGMGCLLLEIKPGPGGGLTATELWTSMKMKTQFNSPALVGKHLLGLDDGRLACMDLKTGERLWKEGRFASGQSLIAGDKVIVQNEAGSVHLCAADPQGFKEYGQLPALSSKTWNHPVLAGRYLLVRNDREAACYELPLLPQSTSN